MCYDVMWCIDILLRASHVRGNAIKEMFGQSLTLYILAGVYKYFAGFSGFSGAEEVYKCFSGDVYKYFSGAGEVYKYFSGGVYKYFSGDTAGEVYKYFSGFS